MLLYMFQGLQHFSCPLVLGATCSNSPCALLGLYIPLYPSPMVLSPKAPTTGTLLGWSSSCPPSTLLSLVAHWSLSCLTLPVPEFFLRPFLLFSLDFLKVLLSY